MAAMKLANHRPGLDIKRREQVDGPVARVIRSAAPGLTGAHRQQWLTAIERLNLRLLINAQDQRLVRRIQLQTDDIAHLSMNSGSLESLKPSTRCGWRPKARQIRPTLAWLKPQRLAIARVLQ